MEPADRPQTRYKVVRFWSDRAGKTVAVRIHYDVLELGRCLLYRLLAAEQLV